MAISRNKFDQMQTNSLFQGLFNATDNLVICLDKHHQLSAMNAVAQVLYSANDRNLPVIPTTHKRKQRFIQTLTNPACTVEWKVFPIIEGEPLGFLLVGKLISKVIEQDTHELTVLREAKEAAEAANRAKSEFIAVMSHEFRIPLTSVLGMAQLIVREGESEQDKEKYAYSIIQAGKHLMNLINDLLDFSKIEANRYEIIPCNIELSAFLNQIKFMLEPQAQAKELEFTFDYDPTLPKYIYADAKALRQIIINLVGNAIKFTEEGFVHVSLNVKMRNDEQVTLLFSVRDSGIGISEAGMKKIFGHFEQVDYSYSRQYGGTGLGLAITKRLVELMEGDIAVTSQLHKGSTFTCEFSFNYSDEQTIPRGHLFVNGAQSNVGNQTRKISVLLVEDDIMIQLIHKKFLQDLGCNVEVIGKGQEALECCNNDYDIIFMDMGLPGVSGIEVIAKYRSTHSKHHPPIIALTGYSSSEDQRHFLESGADEVLVKPVSYEHLAEVILRYSSRFVQTI